MRRKRGTAAKSTIDVPTTMMPPRSSANLVSHALATAPRDDSSEWNQVPAEAENPHDPASQLVRNLLLQDDVDRCDVDGIGGPHEEDEGHRYQKDRRSREQREQDAESDGPRQHDDTAVSHPVCDVGQSHGADDRSDSAGGGKKTKSLGTGLQLRVGEGR